MKAIIMAGGRGTRLLPVTQNLPKPLVPVLNEPIILRTARLLRAHGVREIGVTVSHQADMIISAMSGMRGIRFFFEDSPRGTAGGVKNAEDFLDSAFLVMSGDAETSINIRAMLAFHRASGAPATMALTRVADPEGFGIAYTEGGFVKRFVEKPDTPCGNLVNCGIYILEPEILRLIPDSGTMDFGRELFPYLVQNSRVAAYIHRAFWSDIGTPAAYLAANITLARGKNVLAQDVRLEGGTALLGGVVAGRGAVLRSGIYQNCVLMPGTQALGARECIMSNDYVIYPNAGYYSALNKHAANAGQADAANLTKDYSAATETAIQTATANTSASNAGNP